MPVTRQVTDTLRFKGIHMEVRDRYRERGKRLVNVFFTLTYLHRLSRSGEFAPFFVSLAIALVRGAGKPEWQ